MKRLRKKKPQRRLTTGKETPFFPSVQTKLAVGKAGDSYEVEADKMADSVVKRTGSKGEGKVQKKEASEEELQQKPLASSISSIQRKESPMEEEPAIQKAEAKEEEEPIQKKEAPEEEESLQKKENEDEESLQKQETEEEEQVQKQEGEEEEESLQTKASTTPKADSKLEVTLKNSKGLGSKIEANTRAQMEQGFGVDFSKVNIHTNSTAVQMNKELGAQAFTHGNDIYFNEGKYSTGSNDGKHLLAHELTHTVQQGKSDTKLQREPEPKGGSGTLIDRMKVLKKEAIYKTMTADQETEFVAGLNTLISGIAVPGIVPLIVKKHPGITNFQPNTIYFDKNNEYTKSKPAVTMGGTYINGNFFSNGTFIPGQQINGAQPLPIVFLGPRCIDETPQYTQSIIEHEGVHVQQILQNTGSTAANDEVMGYSEQFKRIYNFSDTEIYSTLANWVSDYAKADPNFRTAALEIVSRYLIQNFDNASAQRIMTNIPKIKTYIKDKLASREADALIGINYIENTLTGLMK